MIAAIAECIICLDLDIAVSLPLVRSIRWLAVKLCLSLVLLQYILLFLEVVLDWWYL